MSVYMNVNVELVTSTPIEHKLRVETPDEFVMICSVLTGNLKLLETPGDYVHATFNVPMDVEGKLHMLQEYQQNGTFKCTMNWSMRSCDHTDIPDVLDCMTRLFNEIGHGIIISASIKIESTYDDKMFDFDWDLKEKRWVGGEVETLNSKGE